MHAVSPDLRSVAEPRVQGRLTLPVQSIDLSRDRNESLYQQLYTQIRGLITDACPAGTRLPASRGLADHLGVSRNTVMLAYQRLHEDGYVSGRAGGGTVVQAVRRGTVRPQPGRPDSRKAAAERDTALPGAAFAIGVPPVDLFPLGLWTSLLSRKLRTSGDRIMRGGNGMGQWPLRRAIAASEDPNFWGRRLEDGHRLGVLTAFCPLASEHNICPPFVSGYQNDEFGWAFYEKGQTKNPGAQM